MISKDCDFQKTMLIPSDSCEACLRYWSEKSSRMKHIGCYSLAAFLVL